MDDIKYMVHTVPAPTEDRAIQTPVPPPPPITDTSTQTTSPNSITHTSTSDPKTEADHQQRLYQYGPTSKSNVCRGSNTTTSPSPRQPPKDKGKAPAKVTPPPSNPPDQPKFTIHASTSRGTSRGSNKIQAGSDASLDRRGQQDSANPGNPLTFKGGQKNREAGIITGHLHDGDNRPYTRAPHGQETIPYYGIRLGDIGSFTFLLAKVSAGYWLAFYTRGIQT
ncbi:hypothetical protein L211DRAFT_535170 [Terfezia boudieri ATCC MYA-4762]|uniref:Uncharacterized protein n=1 Tax=Terfezia boudieri ATCC MYA-4762 TaxID=1051890 RepID=A0A3N4LWR7_9PEZI|nr:hypothetical protein L211DRAFT_535170 [Terfezia boudieri ATCC MYA-4762]